MKRELAGGKTLDVEFILETIRTIGDSFLPDFRKNVLPGNWADFKSQFAAIGDKCMVPLKAALDERYPGISWSDEDELNTPAAIQSPGELLHWRCDSLDGAVQYMMHLPGWTINLSLVDRMEVVFSAVYDPLMKDMFWAEAGKGAFLNGQPLIIGDKADPSLVLAAMSHPPFSDRPLNTRLGELYTCLLNTFGAVRNYGPTSLQIAAVGAGRIDVFFEAGSDTDNWLAGILIAREAGASVTNAAGQPWKWGDDSLVVANPSIAAVALENCGNR